MNTIKETGSLETVLLTKAKIEECESLAHSYTKATIRALGGQFHNGYPLAGWKQKLIGTRIPVHQFNEAKVLRSKNAIKADAPGGQPFIKKIILVDPGLPAQRHDYIGNIGQILQMLPDDQAERLNDFGMQLMHECFGA